MEAARPIEDSVVEEKPPTQAPVQARPTSPPIVKRPFVAGFLSLFPGIGNIYNGLYLRGIIFFVVVAGILLIVLGAIASLQLYLGIDLSWMIQYWPLAIIAFGAWLVFAWIRERRKASGDGEEIV